MSCYVVSDLDLHCLHLGLSVSILRVIMIHILSTSKGSPQLMFHNDLERIRDLSSNTSP